MDGDLPRVAVVVPVRDAPAGIASLLAALGRQTLPRDDFEVVVVDDGSREPIAAPDPVRVERLQHSQGSYAARNRGIAATTAPVIAFTDADCRPAPDWLEEGLRRMDALQADLLGGRIAMSLSERPSLAEAIDVARGLDQRRCVTEWGFAATANVFVRRQVIAAVGPFDERLRSGGDDDFSRRAVAAGFALRYADEVVVEHEPRRTGLAVAKKSLRVGRGHAHLAAIRRGRGEFRLRWTTARGWRPRRGLMGMETLEAHGYRPAWPRRLALDVAQYGLVQLPMLVGQMVGALEARARRG